MLADMEFMMTYEEAKVFETLDRDAGAKSPDIYAASPFHILKTINTCISLQENGYVERTRIDGTPALKPTAKGVEAYERWKEVPF